MSAHAESGTVRQALLTRLREENQQQGGAACLVPPEISHPERYVHTGDRATAVVAEDTTGNQGVIWGCAGRVPVAQVAAALCGEEQQPARSQVNPAEARHAVARGVA